MAEASRGPESYFALAMVAWAPLGGILGGLQVGGGDALNQLRAGGFQLGLLGGIGGIGNGAVAGLGAGVHLLGIEAFALRPHQAVEGVVHVHMHRIDGAGLGGEAGMGLGIGDFGAEIGGQGGAGNQERTRGRRTKANFMEASKG